MRYVHQSSYMDGAEIGEGTKVWHFCHLMEGSRVGYDSTLGQNVFIGRGVHIGDRVKIQNNVSVYEGVTIENDVFIGPSVVFTNVKQPNPYGSVHGNYEQTTVKAGAMLGANCTIIAGVTIGDNAVVGAGSVVTHDVEPGVTVVGNPARPLTRRVQSDLP